MNVRVPVIPIDEVTFVVISRQCAVGKELYESNILIVTIDFLVFSLASDMSLLSYKCSAWKITHFYETINRGIAKGEVAWKELKGYPEL